MGDASREAGRRGENGERALSHKCQGTGMLCDSLSCGY